MENFCLTRNGKRIIFYLDQPQELESTIYTAIRNIYKKASYNLNKKKVDVIQIETTHLGRVSIGTGEGQRTDYKAIEKAIAPSFVHSCDAAVLKSSFQDLHKPIALMHDCLKVLFNDMDKAKERIKHGFVQVCKDDPLARLADEMGVSSEQLTRLTRVLEASQPS